MSKVIEKLIHNQIVRHMESNKLLYNRQAGYRVNNSCDDITADLMDDILKLKDLKKILRKYKEVHSKECLLKCFEHFYSTIGESLSILRQTITLAYSFAVASVSPPDLRTDLCCWCCPRCRAPSILESRLTHAKERARSGEHTHCRAICTISRFPLTVSPWCWHFSTIDWASSAEPSVTKPAPLG